MSKKIVLNSFLAIMMVGFVLSFSSCKDDSGNNGTKTSEGIVGIWKYEKAELTDFSCSDPSMTATLKSILQQSMESVSGNEVEFTKDGKAIFRSIEGYEEAAYEVKNNKLTITSEGVSETYDLSFPDTKTMLWDMHADAEMLAELSGFFSELFEEDIEITKCSMRLTLKKQ